MWDEGDDDDEDGDDDDDDDDYDDDDDDDDDELWSLIPRFERRFLVSDLFDCLLSSAASSTAYDRRLTNIFVPKSSTPLAPSLVTFLQLGQEMLPLLATRFKQHAQKVWWQVSVFGALPRVSLNRSKHISQDTSSAMVSFFVRA